MPNTAPNSVWSLGAKSNFGGSPQRLTSTLLSSLMPSGTSASRMLGISNNISSRRTWMVSSSCSFCFRSSPRCATSSSSGWMSSPRALACPIDLDRVLRWFCNSWVNTWISLRRFSSAEKAALSIFRPRLANCVATSSKLVRNKRGSSILLLPFRNYLGKNIVEITWIYQNFKSHQEHALRRHPIATRLAN